MINIALLSTAHTHTRGYLEAIAQHERAQLVAIWDDMAERGQHFAGQYGAEFSGELDAVIGRDDVDGFIICAENTRHLPLLEAAVPAGKPIFCEKPFTARTAEAAKALKLIRTCGTVVHMGYFQPFSGIMQGIARELAVGALGTVTHARFRIAHHAAYGRWFDAPEVAWFCDPELAGGGAFMDMGTHAVHLVRTLLGPVEKAIATIGNASGVYPRVDDNGTALLRFASGVLGTVEASWVQTGGPGGLEITGSEGTLHSDAQAGYVIASPGKDPRPVAEGESRPTQVDRLIAAIEGKLSTAEFEADLQCAADAVAIIEACYESSRLGSWVEVPAVE